MNTLAHHINYDLKMLNIRIGLAIALFLFSGRTLLDRLCMHHGDGSTEEEAKELCHRMLVQGLLHAFSDSTGELHGDSIVSATAPVFNVRPFFLCHHTHTKKDCLILALPNVELTDFVFVIGTSR